MLPHAEALTAEYHMLPAGCRVLCALSGGADSVCLLHWLSSRPGITLYAAHLDHRLRGAESEGDAAFAEALCRRLGIPLTLERAEVAQAAREAGRGIEETARRLRYDFLRQTAAALGCDVIATAHNADDNAETLLLHLVRGAGLHGLTGIAPSRDGLIRPLLTTTRADILAYLDRHGLSHREDSSNTDTRYARNLLRAQVMPVLRQLNPSFPQTAAACLETLRLEDGWLDSQAAAALEGLEETAEGLSLPAAALARLPDPLAPRAARLLLGRLEEGCTDCAAAHLRGLVQLSRSAEPSASLSLPHGLTARRVYDRLVLTRQAGQPPELTPAPLNFHGLTRPTNSLWQCRCHPCICPETPEERVVYLRRTALAQDAALTPRQPGDRLALPGRRGTKTVKKWLMDSKLPRLERSQIPVLRDADGVAALAGFGPSAERVAAPGEEAWAILFEPADTNP